MAETHWKQNFNYKYTGAYELKQGEERTVTINRTCNEEVMNTNGKKELCFVAYFKDHPKPMVMNKTNCKTIEKMYGPIIEQWPGKRITIVSKKVKAFGEMVDALRVKHQIPKNETANFDKYFDQISSCKTLEQLKTVYMAFPSEIKAITLAEKDKKKLELSGGKN